MINDKCCAGSHYWAAVTEDGQLYVWGQLGTRDEYHKYPRHVPGLSVAHVSAGPGHVAVVDTDHRVWVWGDNHHGQLGSHLPSVVPAPELVSSSGQFSGVSAGMNQIIAWSPHSSSSSLPVRAPFVIDVCSKTFRLIDQLLSEVWDGLDGRDWPPSQEQECVATSCLNLLRLQLVTVIQHNISVSSISLQPGSSLLRNIKKKVVDLATNTHVLDTVQFSAQRVLESSWTILLPTPDERARALSNLLPHQSSEHSLQSSGRRFMTDLLVSSLMEDGGLKSSLMAAIKLEMKELEDASEKGDKTVIDKPGDTLMTEQAQLESETKRAAELSNR